ncbi:MAG: glutamate--cysteine ligase [Candidatus Margulisiibacteriota bacterium]
MTLTQIKNKSQLSKRQIEILQDWVTQKSKGLTYNIYASLDLRISDFKTAVVDTNLFPAGFNNLCDKMLEHSSRCFGEYIRHFFPRVRTLTIYTEAHTRNLFYFKNLLALGRMVETAGFICLFTHPLLEGEVEGLAFSLMNLKKADLILSNNDFSEGFPQLLRALDIPVIPRQHLAWTQRRKSKHFAFTKTLASELSGSLGLDPWFFSADFEVESQVDLRDQTSIDRLKDKASRLLMRIRQKYSEYGIADLPTLFIKDDAGTYGMGIMTIRDASELDVLSRKMINKMSVGKQHRIQSLLLQEGVPSRLLRNGAPAEPVIYCLGNQVVGAFLRVNASRDRMSNLNSKGMEFYRLCREEIHDEPMPEECIEDCLTDGLTSVSVQVALLASALENTSAL